MLLRRLIPAIVLFSLVLIVWFFSTNSRTPAPSTILETKPSALIPGKYRLYWRIPEQEESYNILRARMRRLTSEETKQFKGLKSRNAVIYRDARFIALIDEFKGTGKGYDTGYLIMYPTDAAKVGLADAIRYYLDANDGYGGSAWQMSVIIYPTLGGKGSHVVRRMLAEVGFSPISKFYHPKSWWGYIQIRLHGEWYGKIPTRSGYLNVKICDMNSNAIYGEHPIVKADGRVESYGDCIELGDKRCRESDRTRVMTFDDVIPYAGTLYKIETSKAGDTLTVKPYSGEAGTLCINATDGQGKPADGIVSIKRPYGEISFLPGVARLPVGDYICNRVMVYKGYDAVAQSAHKNKHYYYPGMFDFLCIGKVYMPISIRKNQTTQLNVGKKLDLRLTPSSFVNGKLVCVKRVSIGDRVYPLVQYWMGKHKVGCPRGVTYVCLADMEGMIYCESVADIQYQTSLYISDKIRPGKYQIYACYDTGEYQGWITDKCKIEVEPKKQAENILNKADPNSICP